VVFNPGEPLIDERTDDWIDDPETGDAVIASSDVWVDPGSGYTQTRDEVANAIRYRIMLQVGDAPRDGSRGVDYINDVFSASIPLDVALGAIAEDGIEVTPGVSAVTGIGIREFDATARTAEVVYRVVKADSTTIVGATVVG